MAELIDNTSRNRFEMMQEGQLTHLDYRLEDGRLVLLYVEVPRALQGRGFAADLLRAALARAREQQLKVVAVCSYVQLFLRRHPEYDDLNASMAERSAVRA